MPAQFAPRGTAALEAAQEQGRQILQQSNIQNANFRQAKEIAARREMAMREEAMRRDMANQAIIARQMEMAQAAEIQAQRDARIDGYEKQRTDELFEKRRAEQDYEATGGYTALEVAKIANQRGMPIEAARRGLIEEKQRVDQEREIEGNYKASLARFKAGEDVKQATNLEWIASAEKYAQERMQSGSPEEQRAIQEQLIPQIRARKAGLEKAPEAKSMAEQIMANPVMTPSGEFMGYPDEKGKLQQPRNVGGGAGGPSSAAKERKEASLWPKDGEGEPSTEEINSALESSFYGQTRIKDGKHVPKTAADATIEDRELVRSLLTLKKHEMAVITTIAREKMDKEHLDPQKALDEAYRIKSEAKTAAAAQKLVQDAKRARIYNEHLTVQGKPIPSQYSPPPPSSQPAPGDGGAGGTLERARRALQNPNLPPGLRAQIEEQLRSQ